MKIRTKLLTGVTVSRLDRMLEVIDLAPPYQREGGVWNTNTRRVLIDSIVNGLDLPKLYFESELSGRKNPQGLNFQYAVIDGKQRLEAIVEFLRGRLTLPDDFIFYEDASIKAHQMTLAELASNYPLLHQRFLDYELPIVRVTTDSGDLIEEMFQRLNASTALNAAERRNALKGPTRDAANALAEHDLLKNHSPIKSARYKYRELAAKFLAIEHQLATRGRLADTKATTLYALFTATRGTTPAITAESMQEYEERASETLDRMTEVFDADDRLLASIGTVVVYYIAFRESRFAEIVDRDVLVEFESLRREVSQMNENDPAYGSPASTRLREYNSLVQSTNDGTALARRSSILTSFVTGYTRDNPLAGLQTMTDGELPEQDNSEET